MPLHRDWETWQARGGKPDLLLMRMEALGLDTTRTAALMPREFSLMAHVCDYCQDKVRCERDLLYEAAGNAVSWEHYCPNVARLRAMAPHHAV
jgi:hypothetical protein